MLLHFAMSKERKNNVRETSRQRTGARQFQMASENQSIPKENFPYMPAAHREADTQRPNLKNGKGKMSAEDEEEGIGSLSNGDSIARWRR